MDIDNHTIALRPRYLPKNSTNPMEQGVTQLQETVIQGDFCVGCGVCASYPQSPLEMSFDGQRWIARLTDNAKYPSAEITDVRELCPFSDRGPDEDQLAQRFEHYANHKNEIVGYWSRIGAAHAADVEHRKNGSSGGMVTWLLCELLDRNLVDRVVHVGSSPEESSTLFEFRISKTKDEIRENSKTRYYPVQMSDVIREMREQPARYAVVGIPCFLKALLRLAEVDPLIAQRITYTLGIVCGHLKTTSFTELIATEAAVKPDNVLTIDYRHKLHNSPADKYAALITDGSRKVHIRPMTKVTAKNWGHGMFKLKACDYCDDIAAEVADISFGDAWLPQYIDDSRGRNIVIVRSETLSDLVSDAADSRTISWDELSPKDFIQSQAGSVRHRRNGLKYRLYQAQKTQTWHPRKRLVPTNTIDFRTRALSDIRADIRKTSSKAWLKARQQSNTAIFYRSVAPLMLKHDKHLPVKARIRSTLVMIKAYIGLHPK